MVVAIRTLLDISTLSVVEVTGRLKASEDSFEEAPATLHHEGKLYMTADEWESRRKKGDDECVGGGSGSSGARGGGRSRGRGRGRGNSGLASSRGPANSPGKVGRDQCRRCGQTGHWARECPQNPKKEAAHFIQDEEEASLLLVRSTPLAPSLLQSKSHRCRRLMRRRWIRRSCPRAGGPWRIPRQRPRRPSWLLHQRHREGPLGFSQGGAVVLRAGGGGSR
jgi:hypothetical protein